jgi:hypothetical protein
MKITMGHRQATLKIKQWIKQKRYLNLFRNPVLILAICASQYFVRTSEQIVKITSTNLQLSPLNLYQ